MGQNEENVVSSNGVREQNGNMDESINGREDNSDNMGSKVSDSDSGCSVRFKKSEAPRTGGSILCLMEELVKEKYYCLRLFRYDQGSMGEDYAQHDLRDKRILWDYLAHVSNQWDGEVMLMGDFNEVRYKSDRFGSIFSEQGANMFNSFMSNAGLEEVPLGGSAFTWCHKSASKMSKLDRYAWSLESSGEFLVASIRKKINDNYLPNVSSMTRWVKYVPIKVNILA
nr:RNA-directed DNA polymerase, eukaryota [Tanacetum cinerariifolium]